MHEKRGLNPALPRRTDMNYADCSSCNHFGAGAFGTHCSEYKEEPAFDCMAHTGRVLAQRQHVLQRFPHKNGE